MSSENKPIILTNFGYQRKNWIAPLEAIKDDFEVIYIHFNRKEDESESFTDSTILYFSDFDNAQDLLDKVKPDIFIAMGLYSNVIYAIKHICNKRNIPFVYMDHGVYGSKKDYLEYNNAVKKSAIKTSLDNIDNNRSSNINFPLNSFIKSYAVFKTTALLLRYFLNKISKGNTYKNLFQKFLAKPDAFFTYSKLNNEVNQHLYHPKEKQVYYIGNIEFDSFKNTVEPSSESYLLLIDSPISDNPKKLVVINTEDHIRLYSKINKVAQEKNLKLKVKLHPYNYNSEWIPELSNVEFIKNCDINSLIKNADYCLSFYSTLLIPSLYFVPTSVLKTNDHTFLDFLEKEKLCFIYDLEDIENTQIEFKPVLANQNVEFLENYFNLQEDSSINRIKKAIENIIRKKN